MSGPRRPRHRPWRPNGKRSEAVGAAVLVADRANAVAKRALPPIPWSARATSSATMFQARPQRSEEQR